jgi:hypothetical protein
MSAASLDTSFFVFVPDVQVAGTAAALCASLAGDRLLGTTAAEDAGRFGVDLARLGPVCDGYQVLGYAPEPAVVGAEVAAYRSALPAAVTIRTALRPSWPDCTSPANLAGKITAATANGARGIDFYHYGLVSDDALQRVREWKESPA